MEQMKYQNGAKTQLMPSEKINTLPKNKKRNFTQRQERFDSIYVQNSFILKIGFTNIIQSYQKKKNNITKRMDFLREIVSGPKNRYQKDGFNLDLTYITPRVIAMAYPAEGFQKLYRNSIDSVAQFLQKNHGTNYQIINVSGRQVNPQKLLNIKSFYWEDHKTPQLHMLFKICSIMMEYLLGNQERVSVIHCNHGKGRTGTLICCFLLYSGYFTDADEAMAFYAKQRFEKEGYGVTQPCQIKYIYYFNQILRSSTPLFPAVVNLTKIEIQGKHELNHPYFKLKDVQSDQYILNTGSETCPILQIVKEDEYTIKIRNKFNFKGDMILQIKHSPIVGKNSVANFPFHTAFLDRKQKKCEVAYHQLSPLSAVKSGSFSKNFKLSFEYSFVCSCTASIEFEDRCEKCKPLLKKEQQNWALISEILSKKQKINSRQLLFGKKIDKNEEYRAYSL